MTGYGLPTPGYGEYVPRLAPQAADMPRAPQLPTFEPRQCAHNRRALAAYFHAEANQPFDIPKGMHNLTDAQLLAQPLGRDTGVLRDMMTTLSDRDIEPVDFGPGTPSITVAHLTNALGIPVQQLRELLPLHLGEIISGSGMTTRMDTLEVAINAQV